MPVAGAEQNAMLLMLLPQSNSYQLLNNSNIDQLANELSFQLGKLVVRKKLVMLANNALLLMLRRPVWILWISV